MKEDLDIIKKDIAVAQGYIHDIKEDVKSNRLSMKKGFKLVCEKLDNISFLRKSQNKSNNINKISIIKKIFNKKLI